MTADQPNGLASLSAQRERARRSMPPPRHPALAAAVEAVPAVTRASAPAPAASAPERKAQPGRRKQPAAPPEPTFKVTLYVDRRTDDFMEATRVEGLTSRPKVDVSRSAVVRLAVRRLMDEMSPAEVKQLLERQTVHRSGPGRKRR